MDDDQAPDTEKAPPPSSRAPSVRVRNVDFPREQMPTLPDGVPSDLWEDAVESERRMEAPSRPAPLFISSR